MIRVYGIRIDESLSKEMYSYLFSIVSKEKQELINRLVWIEDIKRTLYGNILVRFLACKELKISNNELMFCNNKFGKPYLYRFQNFKFNISHSGKWVVCGISEKEIGIDIEQIKDISLDIAKRNFSKIEYIDLISKKETQQNHYFYDLWTLKESYVKYIGKGFFLPINSFSIVRKKEKFVLAGDKGFKPSFTQYLIDEDYKLSVCSEDSLFESQINILELKYILEELYY